MDGQEKDSLLGWSCPHVLLLTDSPALDDAFAHCLWPLLEPEIICSHETCRDYPAEQCRRHYIRRTKQQTVALDGTPLYPQRVFTALHFDLTQGEMSEQSLYGRTARYIRSGHSHARILRRRNVRLAMRVLQRRMASSNFALQQALEPHLAKPDQLLARIRGGRLILHDLVSSQRRGCPRDALDRLTADEEPIRQQQNKKFEYEVLGAFLGTLQTELEAERCHVHELWEIVGQIRAKGSDAKFQKLLDLLGKPEHADDKTIIFAEYEDTLRFLVQCFEPQCPLKGIAAWTLKLEICVRSEFQLRSAFCDRNPKSQANSKFKGM